MSSQARRQHRGTVAEGAVLMVAEAVAELGGRPSVTRKWLFDQGLVSIAPGLGERVVWRRVLNKLEDTLDLPYVAPKERPALKFGGLK